MKSNRKKYLSRIAGMLLVFLLASAFGGTKAEAAKLSALHVEGTKLVNAKGKTVQLKGISTHGLSWFPQYVNQKAFTYMKKKWKINMVRLAMYTAEYNGYCTGDDQNRKNLEKLIDNGVRYAEKAGLYVIIDWHILSDGNPETYQTQAVSFFKKMAKKYKGYSNVLYEICNEPNGGVEWSTIRSYADKVIKTIRKYDKKAVILVGTPTWSQDVDAAAKNPLKGYSNLMYTLHFYAGTHGQELRDRAQAALKAGLPLFVSEFGISDASGNGNLNKTEGKKWLNFLDKNKISYAAWSFSNKDESSALIKSSCQKVTGWKKSDFSDWGKWYVARLS